MDIETKQKSQRYYAKEMVKKWEKALNTDGGIADQYIAEQTAIILENYMQYLNSKPELIAEDQAESSDFVGVNLALLGVLRRVVPDLIAATELVGMQAMATKQSPIFYLSWIKALADTTAGNGGKGISASGEELWGYPTSGAIGDSDPYLSSSKIVYESIADAGSKVLEWGPLVNGTIVVGAYVNNVEVARYHIAGSYAANVAYNAANVVFDNTANANVFTGGTANVALTAATRTVTLQSGTNTAGVTDFRIQYEYIQEGNDKAAQITPSMTETSLRLLRRQMKGKFSIDSETDARAYWGIDLEREMSENMKVTMMNEISREILGDLRLMAALSKTVDYTQASANNVIGNYDDTAKLVLDTLSATSAEIWNQGRLGRGNWIVGNPSTLAIFDRVTGILGSGVKADGRSLSYAGSVQSKFKMYYDPQYPKNEILMGYKGTGASDTGYVYAPYQMIQPTPTMQNYETGDSVKIFYTRYGKTFERINPATGNSLNHIYRGEYNYAKVSLTNFPTLF